MPKTKKNRHQRAQKHFRRAIISTYTAVITAFFLWIANALTTVELPDSGKPTILYSTHTRDDLGLTMSEAIKNAKKSITLVIYTLKDRQIIDSLKRKSQEGIPVKIITDAKASPGVERLLGPNIDVVKRFFSGIMHQKILVIDERQTWIGSANMTKDSLRHYGNLVAAIESEPLAIMATQKANSYTETKRLSLHPMQSFPVGGQNMELWFLPDNKGAVNKIKSLLQTAKKTIRIAMYTWTRQDFANEVIAAAKRGVKVEVAIDKGMASGAGKSIFKYLKKNKVPVRLNKGSALLHHKFLCIDEKILVNGSANWTLAAFEKNDDCFIVLEDLTQEQNDFLNRMWNTIVAESI